MRDMTPRTTEKNEEDFFTVPFANYFPNGLLIRTSNSMRKFLICRNIVNTTYGMQVIVIIF
jgi:NAD-specific glutamate dehydrogenase